MSKTGLVVMDVQKYFITPKTKNLPQKIKKHIKEEKYDFIIFSKFINSENSNFVKKLNWNKCRTSPDTDIVGELSGIALKNHVFEKKTYSVFKSKDFVEFLNNNHISKLFFCGLDLDACILSSAFEAFDLGFDFKILYHLSGSSSKLDIQKSTREVIQRNLQL